MRHGGTLKTTLALGLSLVLAACQTSAPQQTVRAPLPAPTSPAPIMPGQPASYTFAASAPLPSLAPVLAPRPVEKRAKAVLVLDTRSGDVLFEDRADELRHPASLTKLMTLVMLFEAVQKRRLTLATPLRVSANAASQPPSKLGVSEGDTLRVRDAIASLSIRSANDVAVVVAENLAGSEEAFAASMTRRARELGLKDTTFVNASGLPDERQISTARDMGRLARYVRVRYPQYKRYFAAKGIGYDGRTLKATNKLLGKVPGVDGMKTGYVRMSGYNLIATARRDGRDIIVVYYGGRSGAARNAEVTGLVERYLAGG